MVEQYNIISIKKHLFPVELSTNTSALQVMVAPKAEQHEQTEEVCGSS